MSQRAARRARREKKESLRTLLLLVIKRLRMVLARRGPDLYRQFPNMRRPCHTCAFNPSTDGWKGMDKTVMSLLHALGRDEPFYCHEGMERGPDGEYVPPAGGVDEMNFCGGWAVVVGDDEAEAALLNALAEWKGAPLKDVSPEAARACLESFVNRATVPMVQEGTLGYRVPASKEA